MKVLNETLKHYRCTFNEKVFYIELNRDNSTGKTVYAAKTNLLFKDEEGYVPCVGVGNVAEKALENCLKEFLGMFNLNFSQASVKTCEVSLPRKVSVLIKDTRVVFLYKIENGKILLLTGDGVIETGATEIQALTCSDEEHILGTRKEYTKEHLIKYGFYPTFESLSQIIDV